MTVAPLDLVALRTSIMDRTGVTNFAAVGINGDGSHDKGYHLGVLTIQRKGNYPDNDYSTTQLRDRVGADYASAMDVTLEWIHGGRSAAIKWSNSVVAIRKSGLLPEIRAINYMDMQGRKRRYDSLTNTDVPSTDSVDIHTHIEWWRNTEGHRLSSFAVLLNLMDQSIPGAIAPTQPIGDDEMTFYRAPTGSVYFSIGGALVSLSSLAELNAVTPTPTLVNLPQSLVDRALAAQAPEVVNVAVEATEDVMASTLESERGQVAIRGAVNYEESH